MLLAPSVRVCQEITVTFWHLIFGPSLTGLSIRGKKGRIYLTALLSLGNIKSASFFLNLNWATEAIIDYFHIIPFNY